MPNQKPMSAIASYKLANEMGRTGIRKAVGGIYIRVNKQKPRWKLVPFSAKIYYRGEGFWSEKR